MVPKKLAAVKTAASRKKVDLIRTPLTLYEAFGLFLLLTSTSYFAMNLTAQIKAAGATIATVNNYFLGILTSAPFNLSGKLDVTKFQALWTDQYGNLAIQLDQTAAHVGIALTPDIPYPSPPCPKLTDQTLLWNRLTGN